MTVTLVYSHPFLPSRTFTASVLKSRGMRCISSLTAANVPWMNQSLPCFPHGQNSRKKLRCGKISKKSSTTTGAYTFPEEDTKQRWGKSTRRMDWSGSACGSSPGISRKKMRQEKAQTDIQPGTGFNHGEVCELGEITLYLTELSLARRITRSGGHLIKLLSEMGG